LSLAETAALLVAAQNELKELNFNPFTTVGAARENDIGFLQVYDARRGNLVVLESHVASGTPCTAFLGDWQHEKKVGYVRKRHDTFEGDPSGTNGEVSMEHERERKRAKRLASTHANMWGPDFDHSGVELDVVLCEPWDVDPVKKRPSHPLWVSYGLALTTGETPPDTSWARAKELPWLEIRAVPHHLYRDLYMPYESESNRRRRQMTENFMDLGVSSETSLRGLSQIADSGGKLLVDRCNLRDLRHTLTLDTDESRVSGVVLPKEGLRHMEVTDEIRRLRRELETRGFTAFTTAFLAKVEGAGSESDAVDTEE
jgi:hypothetical protein